MRKTEESPKGCSVTEAKKKKNRLFQRLLNCFESASNWRIGLGNMINVDLSFLLKKFFIVVKIHIKFTILTIPRCTVQCH